MTDKEKEFVRFVNIDKAKNKIKIAFLLIIISIATYILPLIFGEFDFGLILEVASLILLSLSALYMKKYDANKAQIYNICAIILIACLIIYDLLVLFTSIRNFVDFEYMSRAYLLGEILSVSYIANLLLINKYLSKAKDPIKCRESTDWFYETLEKEENKIK